MAAKFRFYIRTTFSILYLEDYQLEIQEIITGNCKKIRLFMSQSGSQDYIGKRVCIFEAGDKNYTCTIDDFPDAVHEYLKNPQMCIDAYHACKANQT